MAEQVHEMFPQVELSLIWNDLRVSGSVQATIDNILEGRLSAEQFDAQIELDNNVFISCRSVLFNFCLRLCANSCR